MNRDDEPQGTTWWEKYKVTDLPEKRVGDWTITKEEVTLLDCLRAGKSNRGTQPGTYTMLRHCGAIWMSDTQAEIRDHVPAILQIAYGAERVLLHGLGIGMVLNAALMADSVSEIDVIERESEVIELVGEHYTAKAVSCGKTLRLRCDDAYLWTPPKAAHWNVIWHDIWPSICGDNLEGMKKLHRRFGRRCDWQGSWCRHECECQAKSEQQFFRRVDASFSTFALLND